MLLFVSCDDKKSGEGEGEDEKTEENAGEGGESADGGDSEDGGSTDATFSEAAKTEFMESCTGNLKNSGLEGAEAEAENYCDCAFNYIKSNYSNMQEFLDDSNKAQGAMLETCNDEFMALQEKMQK